MSEKFHTNVEATVKGSIVEIGNNWNQSFNGKINLLKYS